MNWEAMLVCGAKRAMGNSSDDRLLDDSSSGHNPWVYGWADVLDIVNSHAQARDHFSVCALKVRVGSNSVSNARQASTVLPCPSSTRSIHLPGTK